MAGGFWRSGAGSDLRSNISSGRMDLAAYGGQNMMNRGYSNGMGSNAALGLIKGMANQRTDLGHRNDRGQYQTGLDSYGAQRSLGGSFQGAAQRAGMDSYYALNRPMVDSYRDHYVENSHSFGALYVSRDLYKEGLPGMTQYAATERNLYASGAQQGGQFGSSSPQVAGRKRAAGWDSGRGGAVQNPPNSQVSNNRSKKGKGAQAQNMSNAAHKVKSVTGNAVETSKVPQEADVVKALQCVACDLSYFSSIDEFKMHTSSKPHAEMIEAVRGRNQANLEYLRSEAKVAAKKHIIESRKKGMNVQKLQHCPICRCDYYGTYALHKVAFEHDQISQFDQGKCCGRAFAGHDKLIDHQTSIEHIKAQCKEQMSSNTIEKTDIPGKLEDLYDGKIYNIGLNNIPAYEPHKPFGIQVLSEHPGYMCQLCSPRQDFSLTEIREHCASLSHYNNVLSALAEKSGKSVPDIKKVMKMKLKFSNRRSLDEVGEDIEITEETTVKKRKQRRETNDDEIDINAVGERVDEDGDEIDEDALDYEYV